MDTLKKHLASIVVGLVMTAIGAGVAYAFATEGRLSRVEVEVERVRGVPDQVNQVHRDLRWMALELGVEFPEAP